jgi:hypothetical protein
MNPFMLQALADSRTREMRRDGTQQSDCAPRPASASPLATAGCHWPRMRRQVGYALVGAGLRLLTTAGSAPRG